MREPGAHPDSFQSGWALDPLLRRAHLADLDRNRHRLWLVPVLGMVEADMHLGHQMPNLWYEAHLHAGDYDVIGVTLPVAFDPRNNPSLIQNRRIVTHGFRIGEHGGKGINILRNEFEQKQPLSFKNQHFASNMNRVGTGL